ncbi:MAG: hypothetical protein WD845_08190 [Pirellulales bacterium]
MKRSLNRTLLCVGLLALLSARVVAQDAKPGAAQAQFERGFYLQTHEHDPAGAAAAYEQVVADTSATQALRDEAARRLAQVREDVALVSFASLMPPDVMAFAELDQPGEHIERILKMVGLVRGPGEAAPTGPGVPLGNGLVLPADFTVSPALVGELKKLRGAAVGVTSIDDHGMPAGLAVIHPGDCDLLRGAIETAVQVLEPGEPIEGFKTYRIPDFGWVMLTARLVVASDSREQLTAAVARLRDPASDSLAKRPEFQRVYKEIGQPCIFAFVDGQQIVKRFGSHLRGRDAAMIRTLLDLDHFESAAVALGTTDDSIQLRAEVNLMPGHRNMAYALIRTAPITRRSLGMVPKGAAGVVVIGLNPPAEGAAPASTDGKQEPPMISAMDIGREFFHNIDELAVFAMPPASDSAAGKFPEVAAVIAVKDVEKSTALWNQLLTIASLFGAKTTSPPAEVTIEGQPGHSYQFDGLPAIHVVRSPERGLVIGTQGAVAAALKAGASGDSIEKDPAFAGLLAHVTPHTSKAVLVDVGRTVGIAAAMSGGSDARELAMIAQLVSTMKVSLVTDEAPNQLVIRAEVSGLPKYQDVLPIIQQGMSKAPRGKTAAKE